jgi:hypothetical protein
MHFKPFQHVLTGARNKLAPYVDVDDAAALKDFSGVGTHLTKYFSMSADEFYSSLGGYSLPLLRFRCVTKLLGAFMDLGEIRGDWEAGRPAALPPSTVEIDLEETPFGSSAYLAANPDLLDADIDPLEHFLEAGYTEGRRLEASATGEKEVVERLARIRATQRDGVAGYAGVALALNRVGRADQADLLIRSGIGAFGETVTLLREHALLALYESNYAEAVVRWARFRHSFPDDPDGYLYGTLANRLAGHLDAADQIAQMGLQRFPDHPAIALEQGYVAAERRNQMSAQKSAEATHP